MSKVTLVGFQEGSSQNLVPLSALKIHTSSNLVILHGHWNTAEIWDDTFTVTASLPTGVYASATLSSVLSSSLDFAVPIALPPAGGTSLDLTVTLSLIKGVTTLDTVSIVVSTLKVTPRAEALHPREVLLSNGRLTFTLCLKAYNPELTEGASLADDSLRSRVILMAGHGSSPLLSSYEEQHSIDLPVSSSSDFVSADFTLENVLYEDFIFCSALVEDAWGNQGVEWKVFPVRDFLQLNNPPSRLDYDHSTQEVVNMLPLWANCRARDFLALAHDPDFTMKGPTWPYLGDLDTDFLPYDFSEPPVAQRITNALLGQTAGPIRNLQQNFVRSMRLSTSDVGSVGTVYTADIPENDHPLGMISVPSSPTSIVSDAWETLPANSADWIFEAPSEVSANNLTVSSSRLSNLGLLQGQIQATMRVETDRYWSPSQSEAENLSSMSSCGWIGLRWRVQGSSCWRLLWGPLEDSFGIRIERVANDAPIVLFKDAEPRFYPLGQEFTIQIQDRGNSITILLNEQPLVTLSTYDETIPWRSGLMLKPPLGTAYWSGFFGRVSISGFYETSLIGRTPQVYAGSVALDLKDSLHDFLEASPTHADLQPLVWPASGIYEGSVIDPNRSLIEADGSPHQVMWWTKGNQICKGEANTQEVLFRYWIWDPETHNRALTEWQLDHLMLVREWLWVIGHNTDGDYRLFFVDPKTPDPLFPESTLYCSTYADLDIRGLSNLLRSKDHTEVFIQ